MAEAREIRVRTCVGCGKRSDKVALMRIMRTADGVAYDATGRGGGRGAYVCSGECLEQSLKSRKLQRALKCGIEKEVAEGIVGQIARAEAGR